jgi:hypothetical protein
MIAGVITSVFYPGILPPPTPLKGQGENEILQNDY